MSQSKVIIPDTRTGTNRHTLFPIAYPGLWQMYKDGQSSLWTNEEINFSADLNDFMKLSDNQKHFLLTILGFFAGSDGIVNENLFQRFTQEIQVQECKMFFALQLYQETVHSETYSLLIDTYVKDPQKKAFYLNAIDNIPSVGLKAEFANKYINSETASLEERLICFAVVEGIFFSSSFACIYYFKSLGLLNNLTLSNDFISADEASHAAFSCEVYNTFTKLGYLKRLDEATIHSIFKEAFVAEEAFCRDALKCELIGMKADDMIEYTRYVADRLLKTLEYEPLYGGGGCKLDFMKMVGVDRKQNFFEVHSNNYSVSSENPIFSTSDEF